ncbi:MAG: major capsid protein [Microviridae sp.]|nr:MAG: major capsid protein [Microviridae sp.]
MPPMKRMPTVMRSGHGFSQVPSAQIERSVLDRSHGVKATFDAGYLIPVLVDPVLPGDTFTVRMTAFCRLTTPIKPLMDNMYLESFFFFVPLRLVWTNFVKFMGEREPGDVTAYTIPVITVPFTPALHSVYDYMGVMPSGAAGTAGTIAVQTPNKVSCLPIRAFYLIYNQWFRDQNLVASVGISLGDGPDSLSQALLKRGKRHDYFTSCLPFLQKGTASAAAVSAITNIAPYSVPLFRDAVTGLSAGPLERTAAGAATAVQINSAGSGAGTDLAWWDPQLQVDINNLRLAMQIQKLLERDARGGTRYTEKIWSHFRVKSPDARLQRTEYLGGGSTSVVVSPIAQTTQAAAPSNKDGLANLGAAGAAVASGHGFTKSFTEHGYIIGIVNVRADLTYQQGIERDWMKQTLYDMYWPALAHIGEQAVLSQEIYWDGSTAQNANDVSVFGYQERYAEYRYKPSRICGLFRSNAAGTIEHWHLSEKFASRPNLGQTFIEDQLTSVLTNRVAVPAEPDFYGDFYFDMKCARPMPVFGVPGFIDHF